MYQTLWKNSISNKANRVKNHEEGVNRAGRENYIYIGEISGVAPYVLYTDYVRISKEESILFSLAEICVGHRFNWPGQDSLTARSKISE